MALELSSGAVACGKIILLGEHAVVYGQPALAAGLARGLTLAASPLPDPHAPIELSIPAWDLDIRLTADSEHTVARACLEVLGHCDGPIGGWRIVGDARVPCGAGLGSSAALTVALARLALGPQCTPGSEPALDEVIAASMAGERVFHGTPSGIDSAVAARGGVLMFTRGSPIEAVELGAPLHLLMLPSGVPRKTATMVAGVRARRERLPEVIDPILSALGQLTHRGRRALREARLHELAELCSIAHGLLAALGVSHAALERLCAAAVEHGALAAKLTGAGGGGCVFALCESADAAARIGQLIGGADSPATRPFAVDVEP